MRQYKTSLLSLCRYLGSEPSNMALVTVTLGSGMAPDVNQLEGNPSLAKVEVEGSQVHMYINEVKIREYIDTNKGPSIQ